MPHSKNPPLCPTAGDQPVCARCAARFPTCCRMRPAGVEENAPAGWEGECFPLSEAELQRLEEAAARLPGLGELAAEAPNSPAFLQAMLELFPQGAEQLAASYPPGGSHRRMNLKADGSCVCLTPQGCCLPRPARPWFCRLFPLWFQRGRLVCFAPPDCLAVQESRSLRDVLRAFGRSESELLELFEALRQDWGM